MRRSGCAVWRWRISLPSLSPQRTEKLNMVPGLVGLAAALADSERLSRTGPARKVERNSLQILAASRKVLLVVKWLWSEGWEADGYPGVEARYL